MTPLLSLVVYVTVYTFAVILVGTFLRNREWTPSGFKVGLGNRDDVPEATPLGGRADRAAANSIEALLMFAPLALVANAAGRDADVLFGAQVFFWARLAYVPVYWFGIPVVRSLIWGVGVFGLASMVVALLSG